MSQKRQSSGNYEVTEKRRKVCEEVIEVESNSNDSTHVTCNGSADNTGKRKKIKADRSQKVGKTSIMQAEH